MNVQELAPLFNFDETVESQPAQVHPSGLFVIAAFAIFGDGRDWPAWWRGIYRDRKTAK